MTDKKTTIAVILFSKNSAGKGQAGRYGADDIERALAVANQYDCSAVTFTSDDDADLLAAVPEGRFAERDRPLLPAAKVAIFKQLVAMAESEGRHEVPAEPNEKAVGADPKAEAAQAPARQKAAAMRSADGDKATGEAVLNVVIKQGAKHWPGLKAGDVVLAPEFVEGAYNGWWEAVVKARSETYATLEWRGFPDLPVFTVPITQIAPIHPECKIEG